MPGRRCRGPLRWRRSGAWSGAAGPALFVFGPGNVFTDISIFFSKLAMVTFGGAYAVLSYVAQQGVEHYGWLKPGEMLDGLGLAETTQAR